MSYFSDGEIVKKPEVKKEVKKTEIKKEEKNLKLKKK